jgi:hypothetical protein
VEEVKDTLGQDLFNKNTQELSKAAESLNKLEAKITGLEEYTKKHRQYEEVLEFTDFTQFKEFKEVKQGFILRHKLFNGTLELEKLFSEWKEWKVMNMEVKTLSTVRDRVLKDLAAAERGISDNHALPIFRDKVLTLKDSIPIVEALRCPYLQ